MILLSTPVQPKPDSQRMTRTPGDCPTSNTRLSEPRPRKCVLATNESCKEISKINWKQKVSKENVSSIPMQSSSTQTIRPPWGIPQMHFRPQNLQTISLPRTSQAPSSIPSTSRGITRPQPLYVRNVNDLLPVPTPMSLEES